MNNNQNYQQPGLNQQNGYQAQPNMQYRQPYQGQPNMQYQQPYQGYPNQQNVSWQQPPKKKMSAGCIVGIVFGVIFLIGIIIVGILIAMGFMFVNSVQSEFDSIGSEFYNTAYELYLGEEKPANSLFKLMAAVDATNKDPEETHKIKVNIELNDGSTFNETTYDYTRIPDSSKYLISAIKDSKGYISFISIKEK